VLLHAAALEAGGRASLFVGRSGAGKSTWSRWWRARGGTVLDEDRVVLREREGRMWAFGTPWHPEPRLSSPRGAPVARILFLQDVETGAAVPAGDGMTAALLLRHSFLPVYDAEAMGTALGVAGQTALQAPALRRGYATGSDFLDRLPGLEQNGEEA
jgi:hypothetical protein